MKRSLLLIGFLLCGWLLPLSAEVITLRTGRQISGEILFDSDEVLVIRDASGARYQFPKTDILSVQTEQEAQESTVSQSSSTVAEVPELDSRRTAIRVELSGGAAIDAYHRTGGMASGMVMIGSRTIHGRECLLGGMVGYLGEFMPGGAVYHFLPVALALRIPLLEGTHAPELGASVGYGIALSKLYRGGVYADGNIGYRYRAHSGKNVYAGLFATFQMATLEASEWIPSPTNPESVTEYRGVQHRTPVMVGAKLAFTL